MAASVSITVDATTRSPRVARETARIFLERHDLADLVATTMLLLSEVVTNAVIYAGGEIGVSLHADNSTLHVEVSDHNPVPPTTDVDEASGETVSWRGLEIVARLARRWGVSRRPDGKVVWFELNTAGEPGGTVAVRRLRAAAGVLVQLAEGYLDAGSDAMSPGEDARVSAAARLAERALDVIRTADTQHALSERALVTPDEHDPPRSPDRG